MNILLLLLLFAGNTPIENSETSYTISGIITDMETAEPVSFAYVHLEELNRNVVADVDGYYEIKNIPAGQFTLSVHRIGYRTQTQTVTVEDENLEFNIKLRASVLSSKSIEVVGDNENLAGSNLEHASRKVFGEDLRRNLASTLSGTLSELPGFDERSMGAAPGRPVIRGLGDERVLILQDGVRGGDVSNQSADHAVTIDPISAQEVEIARGPAALAYGANAIAGVINVVRNQISTTVPSKTSGNFTINAESVNRGLSGAADIKIPYKDLALSLNLNGRTASDTHTPAGIIENTHFSSANNGAGLSYVKSWGYIGGAFTSYFNNYGIPPEPNGHEHGVDIRMQKYQYNLKSEILVNRGILKMLEGEISLKNYFHEEIENSGEPGTQFGLVTSDFSLNAEHTLPGVFGEGSFGIWGEMEDYAVQGAGTPDANSYKFGTFLIEEANFGKLHLEGGLRYDYVLNRPLETGLSPIGNIRERDFHALSGSVAALYSINDNFTLGGSFLHSFRAPSLEELYSEGPHLASYSFEVGNPELQPERALAKEIFLRYQSDRAGAELALFHNDFSNYLYAQNTGRQSDRFPDLNTYQFVGTEALLYGFEVSAEVQLLKNVVLNGSVSYTIGERDVPEDEQAETGYNNSIRPLPQIPPLKAKTTLRYIIDKFEIGSRLRFAASQTRTGEFETSTEGYTVWDSFLQYRINQDKLMHTLSLNANNILNQEYQNHLSRIKDLRPEPGLNISLLYRLYF